MPSSVEIVSCDIVAPTLERAKRLVPPEFIQAYERILEYEGRIIPRLPTSKEEMARGLSMPLARQGGIYKPRDKWVNNRWVNNKKYALSVHSSHKGRYKDKQVVYRSDGTWILDYAAQSKDPKSITGENSNEYLFNCLYDGVPVLVLEGLKKGYRVLGLAFVEQYVSATDSFILHGPVNPSTEDDQVFYAIHPEELTKKDLEDLEEFKNITKEDERARKVAARVVREQQGLFRKKLLEAYEGACSVTNVNTLEVLQAAHIDPYRGKKSQLVNNGLLLRADIHLLYDAQLLSVEPESHLVHVSDKVHEKLYRDLEGERIRIPKDKRLWPNEDLLDQQFRLYEMANAG